MEPVRYRVVKLPHQSGSRFMKGRFILNGAECNGCSLNHCYSFKIHVSFYLKTCQHPATPVRVGLTEPPGGWRLFCSFLDDSAALTADFSESLNELALSLERGKMSGQCFFIMNIRRRRTAYRVSRLPAATPTLHPHYITATAALIFTDCCSPRRKAPITTGVSFILEHGFN